jgi:protein-disulfide isomerase
MIHPWAYDAAVAAACVGRLKPASYMRFVTEMFHGQKDVTPQNVREKVLKTAKDVGVEEARFAPCYDKKETKPLVDAEIKEADSLGVTATPTLFVNGRRLRSYQPAEVRRIIDEKLAGK